MSVGQTSRKLLKAVGGTFLIFAGFLFILFTESSKINGHPRTLTGKIGIANADAPTIGGPGK